MRSSAKSSTRSPSISTFLRSPRSAISSRWWSGCGISDGSRTMSDSEFEMQDLMPSEEDVAFYQRNGYYVSKAILSDELIAAAWEGSERLYRCEYDERFAWS